MSEMQQADKRRLTQENNPCEYHENKMHTDKDDLQSHSFLLFLFEFFQDRDDHVEFGSFSRFLVHADLDEARHVGRDTRRDVQTQTFHGNL